MGERQGETLRDLSLESLADSSPAARLHPPKERTLTSCLVWQPRMFLAPETAHFIVFYLIATYRNETLSRSER